VKAPFTTGSSFPDASYFGSGRTNRHKLKRDTVDLGRRPYQPTRFVGAVEHIGQHR
jgi:hypothetical protein